MRLTIIDGMLAVCICRWFHPFLPVYYSIRWKLSKEQQAVMTSKFLAISTSNCGAPPNSLPLPPPQTIDNSSHYPYLPASTEQTSHFLDKKGHVWPVYRLLFDHRVGNARAWGGGDERLWAAASGPRSRHCRTCKSASQSVLPTGYTDLLYLHADMLRGCQSMRPCFTSRRE